MPLIFYRVVISLICVLAVLLAAGTIYGLVRPADAAPVLRLGRSDGTEGTVRETAVRNDDIRVYSGLGRLRIPLSNSSIMILSIAFPYSANDTAFMEELAAKTGELRNIAINYFSSLPADELANIEEETAKREILRLYNTALRLGRIEALYFNDMLIIDGSL